MSPKEVLQYWFGEERQDAEYLEERNRIWWRKNPEVDKYIRSHFGPVLLRLTKGEWKAWVKTPEGWCAAIIVFDQMPRNMFRGKAEAFAFDIYALSLAKEGLKQGMDHSLSLFQKVFCALPLEHSEDLEDQNQCVTYFTQLCKEAPPFLKKQLEENLEYAVRHSEVIERFGRFPHRNKILGRASTPEEMEHLKDARYAF